MKVVLLGLLAALGTVSVSTWRARERESQSFCARAAARDFEQELVRIEGFLMPVEGRWQLRRPVLDDGEGVLRFGGRVWMSDRTLSRLGPQGPVAGLRVWISGSVVCTYPPKSLVRAAATRPSGARVRGQSGGFLPGRDPVLASGRRLRNWLFEPLRPYPRALALVEAAWTGSAGGLSTDLVRAYRENGLLHVLALSGQHVIVLVLLARLFVDAALFLLAALGMTVVTPAVYQLRRWLPVAAGGALFLTGSGCPSVLRTLGAILFWTVVRARGLFASAIRIAVCAIGGCLLAFPSEIEQVGFVLSAVASLWILWIAGLAARRPVAGFLLIGIAMPIAMLPLGAFFFGEVPLGAPLACLLLGWCWELWFIPWGFLLPFVLRVLPEGTGGWIAGLFVVSWDTVETIERPLFALGARAFVRVPPPELWQVLAFEIGLALCISSLWRLLLRRCVRASIAAPSAE